MMEWITDRQPTTEDECDGEVVMQCFPDRRKSSNGLVNVLVAAAHVGPGVPWRHVLGWQPPATPEPEPEAPKPAPKPELRVGQVWRTREGEVVVIEDYQNGCARPFCGSNGEVYAWSGCFLDTMTNSGKDLIELITDTPAEEPQPKPAPATRRVPRGFLAFLDMPRVPGVMGRRLIAIATDHTGWYRDFDEPGARWRQVEPLPDREEPIDA